MNQVEPITTDELRRRKAELDRGGWPECASFLAYIRDHFEEICAAIDAADADRLDAIEQRRTAMPEFTPEQIKDAMEHPMVGDVWRHRGREITISALSKLFVCVDVEVGEDEIDSGAGEDPLTPMTREAWLWLTRWGNATLLRRGV